MKKIVLLFSILILLFPAYSFADNQNIKVFVSGKQIIFEQQPFIENGNTLVPFRLIFESLGMEVTYTEQGSDKIVNGFSNDNSLRVSFFISKKIIVINNKISDIEVAPSIINGNTFVPLRAIAESTGAKVTWDGTTNSIYIGEVAKAKGNLKGTVTWQYNKFIGTKPDVDAKVFLIPENFKKNSITFDESSKYGIIGSVPKNSGLFFAKANGYGNYEISGIPAGKYYVLISSKNTSRNFQLPVDQYTSDKLKSFIDDYANFELFNLHISNYELTPIEIKANETIDISHDFGNTFI